MKPEDLSIDMTSLGARRTLGPPPLAKTCVIRADIGPAIEFVTTHGTIRAIFPIIGGEARGANWTGRILPGGADFALARPDGTYDIEARYCLELDDGTPVMVTNAGRMVLQPDGSYHGRTRATLEVPKAPTAPWHRRLFRHRARGSRRPRSRLYRALGSACLRHQAQEVTPKHDVRDSHPSRRSFERRGSPVAPPPRPFDKSANH